MNTKRELKNDHLAEADLEAVTGGGNAGLAARDAVAHWFDNYIDRQYEFLHAEAMRNR